MTPSGYIDRAKFACCHRVSPGVTGLFSYPVTAFHKQIWLLSQGVTGWGTVRAYMGESVPSLSLLYVWNHLVTPSDLVTRAEFAYKVVSPGVTGCELPGDIFDHRVKMSSGCPRTRLAFGDERTSRRRAVGRSCPSRRAHNAERGRPREYAVRVEIYGEVK